MNNWVNLKQIQLGKNGPLVNGTIQKADILLSINQMVGNIWIKDTCQLFKSSFEEQAKSIIERSSTVGIWNPTIQNPETHEVQTFLRVGFQMLRFSNGRALAMAIAIVPTIQKPNHSKSGHFFQISYGFWQNSSHLYGF